MISTKNSNKVYQITTDKGDDYIAQWEDFPESIDAVSCEGIKYIRIWSPRTKIFKAIGTKRLVDQFKDHPLYVFLKHHPAMAK